MTQQSTHARFSPPDTVDRNNRRETASPAEHPARSAARLPHSDAGEPAELAVVAVRGYN